MGSRIAICWVLGAVCIGCGPGISLQPSKGPSSGNFTVRASGHPIAKLASPLSVTVGGALGYDVVREDPYTVRFTVQGAAAGGPQTVTISDGHATLSAGHLVYQAPKAPVLSRVVAFGASLTMGVQSATLGIHGQTHCPATQVADAAGAYLSLPLVKDQYMPGLTLADFDLSTCRAKDPNLEQLLTQRGFSQVLPKVTDASGQIQISKVRVDPSVEVRNVAIGGFKIHQVIAGAYDVTTFMEHIVWNPNASQTALFNEPAQMMLDRVVALNPTLAMSTDLFVNDYFNTDLSTNGIPVISGLTPLSSFSADLDTILSRLDTTGAHVYLASGPDVTILPDYQEKVQTLLASGYSQASATGWIHEIQQIIGFYNAELARQAALHPNVHVVDLGAAVADLAAHGVDVGGQHLTTHRFGGLLSLDSIHFSDVGYAIFANVFIRAINGGEGLSIPEIDLAAAMAGDPYSLDALKAQGFACAGTL